MDPGLAFGLSADHRRALAPALRARVIRADPGDWSLPVFDPAKTLGLLVLDGLVGRRIRVGPGVALELIGDGELLRPWPAVDEQAPISTQLEWQMLAPTRLAVLDERVTSVLGRRPELLIAVADHLARRIHSVSHQLAISHLGRVEDRLLGSLWQIAGVSGRVTPNGVRIPFRLTHEILAEVVGARRPSVTVAMQELARRGEVVRNPQGEYVLSQQPAAAA